MDAFESLIEMLLRRQGYWTQTSLMVELIHEEERAIGRPSSPRWELDVVAHKEATNKVLVIECKSFLDSPGALFRDGAFEPPKRYKIFNDERLGGVALRRLAVQLEDAGTIADHPGITLCLAAGKVASRTDHEALRYHMADRGLFELNTTSR